MSMTSRAIERTTRYHPHAFQFVYQALRFTEQSLRRGCPPGKSTDEAHISAGELLQGIRELALEQFGLMTRTVFVRWGVRTTDDFGRIVFELIRRGEMMKTERDQLSDFFDVYDFEEAFDREYRIDVRKVQAK